MTRKPRTDAAHNREHIVAVARAAFADHGLDLPMREIARRSGLGIATVYRHFPARADLVTAALADQVAGCRADMRAALDDTDPWRALSGVIRNFAERQVSDRGLNELLFSAPTAAAFTEDVSAHARGLDKLVDRASQAGVIRPWVTAADVRAGLAAVASIRTLRREQAAASVRRLVRLLLAGLAADPGSAGQPRPASARAVGGGLREQA
jgi:AcrR family transcriptional regulator